MSSRDQVGSIPVWKLNGKPSASGDAARVAQLREVLAKTPLERVIRALELSNLLKKIETVPETRGPSDVTL